MCESCPERGARRSANPTSFLVGARARGNGHNPTGLPACLPVRTALEMEWRMSTDNPPRVAAHVQYRTKHGVWILELQCPYCSRTHTHGGGSDDDGPTLFGHRGSHCNVSESPEIGDMPGYVLTEPNADVDFGSELARASAMLSAAKETRAAAEEAKHATEVRRMADVNAEITRGLGIVQSKRKTKAERDREYLESWSRVQARRNAEVAGNA